MEQEYPWYRIAEPDEELEQGDFIDDCQVLIPKYTPIETEANRPNNPRKFLVEGDEEIRDVVIISQTCDLENRKVDVVHLCPRMPISKYVEVVKKMGKNNQSIITKLNEIRSGRSYRYYMLNMCNLPDFSREFQIVDLGTSFTIPCDAMEQIAKSGGKRIRLLSPYKEQLAQAFAFLYMRVALPNPINEFKALPLATQVAQINTILQLE